MSGGYVPPFPARTNPVTHQSTHAFVNLELEMYSGQVSEFVMN